MQIERVTEKDAGELLQIYAPYVQNTAITFEYEVPSIEEFRQRIRNISAAYPYIKAVEDGQIAGYAYAGRFHPRKAYDWSAESTIYLRQDKRGQGIGRSLYEALEKFLRDMGVLDMNACIAIPQTEDEHLTLDSFRFHEKMGFEEVGRFRSCGYKFDTWYDMVWMSKNLGVHKSNPAPVDFGGWSIR